MVLTSFADAVLALPGLLLVLMLAAISPGSWWALYAGISLTLWVEYFRYTRQRARIVMAEPAVEASRLLGLTPGLIVRRHLVQEIGPGLLTIAAFGAATAVTAVAALGFVSVGVRPPTAEWGVMMTRPCSHSSLFIHALTKGSSQVGGSTSMTSRAAPSNWPLFRAS